MKNRIVSLFQLDELLAPNGNGHARASAGSKTKRKRKRKACHKQMPGTVARAPGVSTSPTSPKEAPVAKSFDTGAPIRCEHAIAYPPVQPVELPTTPSDPRAEAHALDINVEAFEDDDSSIEEPTVRLANDEDTQAESQSFSYEDEPVQYAPEVPFTPTRQAQPEVAEPVLPESFAAQMEAVEADLAELARRADHPPPNAPTPPPEEEAASPRAAVAAPSGHAIFDEMAKGMSYATEFRLPPVQLSQVFTALDRQLDAEVSARPAPDAATVRPAAPSATPIVPPADVLLKDLVNLTTPETPSDVAASLGAAIDVKHEVQLVPQQTGFSCWAAGAAMVVGWRDRISIDPSEIARATGYWAQYASGLNAEDTHMFSVFRLTPEPAQSYTVTGFADLLKRYGPLWVASAEPGPHVRVVTGIAGDGTPTGTLLYINDPWEAGMKSFRLPNRGAQYTESYQRFVERQETLGRQEIKQQGIYVAHA